MNRIRIIGACLVVACTLAALASASSASAAEYGVCLAQKKGAFTEANCQTRAQKRGKPRGSYEWHPADSCYRMSKGEYKNSTCTTKSSMPHHGKYEKAPGGVPYTSTSGEMILRTPEFGPYSAICPASTDTGEITGTISGFDTVDFTGCELDAQPCDNAAPGEIQTYKLETTLEEPSLGDAATRLANAAGTGEPYLFLFGCQGVGTFRVKGSFAGATLPVNVMSTTQAMQFLGKLTIEYLVTGAEWSGGTGGGPNEHGSAGEFPAELEFTSTATTSTAIEIGTGPIHY